MTAGNGDVMKGINLFYEQLQSVTKPTNWRICTRPTIRLKHFLHLERRRVMKVTCAICEKLIDENDWFFSFGDYEKAVCPGCVKEMCPSGNVSRILEAGLKIEWRLAS
jgi:hypothetical protein